MQEHAADPTKGLDRLHNAINDHIKVSRGTVWRVKREAEVYARQRRKWKATTNSNHKLPVSPNLLDQNFTAPAPNKIWTGDITYLPTDEGWLYVAVVKDLYSKDIVGYAYSSRIDRRLVMDAMLMALRRERPGKGLIFHSDRGSQYCSQDFRTLLSGNHILQSMSRRGNPFDNAPSESFFSRLKCECTSFLHFRSREEGKQAVFEYIELYYNRNRRQKGLGWLTPRQARESFCVKVA